MFVHHTLVVFSCWIGNFRFAFWRVVVVGWVGVVLFVVCQGKIRSTSCLVDGSVGRSVVRANRTPARATLHYHKVVRSSPGGLTILSHLMRLVA